MVSEMLYPCMFCVALSIDLFCFVCCVSDSVRGAMVALTVMRVLMFVCEVTMLRECEGDSKASVGAGGGIAVSVGCDYISGTHGSVVVSSADDVLDMSVVRGVRGEVCEMCMCLAWGGRCGW